MTHANDTSASVGTLAAARLMRERDAMAYAVTEALYAERPELIARHGERGREKTLQDMRHNIDHLIPAVDMGDDAMFVRYVDWVNGLLNSYGVETTHLIRCLELLRGECDARMPDAEARAVASPIDAGLRVLVPA